MTWNLLDPAAVARATGCSKLANVQANLPLLAQTITDYGYTPQLHTNLWIAVLGTVAVETAYTFAPVAEFGGMRYLQSKPYYPFYGRGYLQVTWKANYQEVASKLGIDCVNQPDLLLQPVNAAKALCIFITDRPKMVQYAHDGDWEAFRRIVNGGENGLQAFLRIVNNGLIPLAG